MKIFWQPWMRWLDESTGELNPSAPPSAVEAYNEYMKLREEYRTLTGRFSQENWEPEDEDENKDASS